MRVIAIMMLATSLWQSDEKLKEIREAYFTSMQSENGIEKFEYLVDSVNDRPSLVMTGYKGAAQMFKARQALSPTRKFYYFSNGKKLIDLAISKDTAKLECRFLRYTIQRNLPHFLHYDQSLNGDRRFIEGNLSGLKDEDLRQKIVAYLKLENSSAKLK